MCARNEIVEELGSKLEEEAPELTAQTEIIRLGKVCCRSLRTLTLHNINIEDTLHIKHYIHFAYKVLNNTDTLHTKH